MRKNSKYFLVLDIGTSGIKALIFTEKLDVIGRSHKEIKRFFPYPKFVEQDPYELVKISIFVIKDVIKKNRINPKDIIAIGITNQRETTILWDKKKGTPVYNAIVWEDERTEKFCESLKNKENLIRKLTGLFIIPYFSATKINWILKNVKSSEKLLKEDNLLFGTVDTWILWNITKEKVHKTDLTNASRTLVFNNKNRVWDKDLLNLFSIPEKILPKVFESQHEFGTLKKNILGIEIPIMAICGDQQSSMYAAGIEKGETKVTYGTGAFIMQSLGKKFAIEKDFFTTIIPHKNGSGYALEAKINSTGETVSRHLKNKKMLFKALDEIAAKVAQEIKKMPNKPLKITVDGGITREKYLIKQQEKILGIPVIALNLFDGTALGTAKLLKDSGF